MSLQKYRDNFPQLCRHLAQARLHNRTGQAYLLVGDDPFFLLEFAQAWAQTAACLRDTADGYACGQCANCQAFALKSYPNLLLVQPESKSRQITIDAMRDFDQKLSLASGAGQIKVGIISEAECLGEEAQNAFLKTLEEPPPNTLLLLLTTVPRRLLPTIRSRCQRLLLLKNRRNYRQAQEAGLFEMLAGIHRGAGCRAALNASARLLKMFKELHNEAEKFIEDNWDERWDTAAEDNRSLKKQLEEQKATRIEAEYVRLRGAFVEAIQSWFQARYLLAAGCAIEKMDCPEMASSLATIQQGKIPSLDEAAEDLKYAAEYSDCLKSNVEESLALDTMLLQICEKTPN